jgi:hypothetical protein
MKKLLLTTLTVLAVSSVNAGEFMSSSSNWNNGNNACATAISAAKAENKKAKKAGFEWRDTGKMMKAGKKAGGKKCLALASKAKAQALNAQQQAKDQANAGPSF